MCVCVGGFVGEQFFACVTIFHLQFGGRIRIPQRYERGLMSENESESDAEWQQDWK